ncbi:LysM peptidoglycan-binding domain-containing protein [Leuconostoc gasicomitatum]|uniref:LysM domain-containing protein n=1 Tax=Leuconostoc gasicomitatum TaxID=115778 RepID=A0A9Q3SU50_9LACO|nr:LysM peptidoglycan-binding domain-containing protein [Leuconostoc gasicomitatum]MBZ5961751.1 hypothetical protein [Leuconostoc gasicomitatum]
MKEQTWKLVKVGKYLVSAGIVALIIGGHAVAMASTSEASGVLNQEPTTKLASNTWFANSADTVKHNIADQKKSADLDNYEVQWGDTLSTISEASGVSVTDLSARYGITNVDRIYAGVTLSHQKDYSGSAIIANAGQSVSTDATQATTDAQSTNSATQATTDAQSTNGATQATTGAQSTNNGSGVNQADAGSAVNPINPDTGTDAPNGSYFDNDGWNTPSSTDSATSTDKGSSASTDNGSGVNHAPAGSAENPINPDTGTDAPNGSYFDNDGWNTPSSNGAEMSNGSATSSDNGSGINHAPAGSAKNPIDPDTGTAAPNGAYFDNSIW